MHDTHFTFYMIGMVALDAAGALTGTGALKAEQGLAQIGLIRKVEMG